jgi:hypothetical protein
MGVSVYASGVESRMEYDDHDMMACHVDEQFNLIAE